MPLSVVAANAGHFDLISSTQQMDNCNKNKREFMTYQTTTTKDHGLYLYRTVLLESSDYLYTRIDTLLKNVSSKNSKNAVKQI